MGEQLEPEDMQVGERYSTIDQKEYSNGAKHLYGVNAETGKKEHISHSDVMSAYGYGKEDEQGKPGDAKNNPNGSKWSRPVLDANGNPADPNWRRAGYDAVENPLNLATGLESYEQTKRRAAVWNTHVRPIYREWKAVQAGEEVDPQVAEDAELARKQCAREGKAMPSQDDLDYMLWLEEGGNEEAADIYGPEWPLPAELGGKLEATRDEYVRLTALRRRVSTVGYKKQLEAARIAYEEARDEAGAHIARLMQEGGLSEDQIHVFGRAAAFLELRDLEVKVGAERVRIAEGKKFAKFYKWWANQGGKLTTKAGLIGTAKKGLAMTAITAVPGLAVGLAGSVVLGPVVGGLIGAAVSRAVARGLAASKINKEASVYSVAGLQAAHQNTEGQEALYAEDYDKTMTAEDVTAQIERGTKREVTRNRRRHVGSIAIGAVAGAAGAALGGLISGDPTEKLRAVGNRFNPKIDMDTPNFQPKISGSDGNYPWTHFAEKVGDDYATPHILGLRDRAMEMGWIVNGEVVPGPNNDQIVSLIDPWGRHYEGNAAINAALDYIDKQPKV